MVALTPGGLLNGKATALPGIGRAIHLGPVIPPRDIGHPDGGGTVRMRDVGFRPRLVPGACGITGESLARQQWADDAGTQPFQQACPAR
jgi:hypothetical protein